jgi:hypothetical protein
MELKFVIQVPRLGVILLENITLQISYLCYNMNMAENDHHECSKDRGVEKPEVYHKHQKSENPAHESYIPITIPLSH